MINSMGTIILDIDIELKMKTSKKQLLANCYDYVVSF